MRTFAALCVLVAVAAPTLADVGPDEFLEIWADLPAGVQASFVVCPCGDGDPLDQMRRLDGYVVSGVIHARALDYLYHPIVGRPAEDFWLESEDHGLAHLPGGTIADHPTDATGATEWREPLRAGGHLSPGDRIRVWYAGDALGAPPFAQFRLNSPDINGDLRVDLSDLTLFAHDFSGPYDYRSDFQWNGAITLNEITIFARHFGHDCR